MPIFDAASLVRLPPRITHHRFSKRDTMLYALGLGAGQGDHADDLTFVYEEGLRALPTMAAVLGYPGFWQKESVYGIDWPRVLHVGQSLMIHKPLPVEGEIRGELSIDRVIDKGSRKGALLYAKRRIVDARTDELLATLTQVSLLRGDGGFGGTHDDEPSRPHQIPSRAPDALVTLDTRPEQALLYRLSGDYNPLHADPAVARKAGLLKPVLHGLATFGIAGRAILRTLCENDPARLRQLDCRFTAPVYPGDSLEVTLWREGQGAAAFQVRVAGRPDVVLDNGYARADG